MATKAIKMTTQTDQLADWAYMVKRTIARFARGNISAQKGRILLPNEQEKKHKKAVAIALRWKTRNAQSAS